MSPEIEHLITLQRTDREIQRLKAEIAELPKRVAAIEEETAEIEKEKEVAHDRTAQDGKELAEWTEKRDAARAAVDPDLRRHYDRVLKFRGAGLAEVRDQKCMGCSVVLRPQTYNEVRSG